MTRRERPAGSGPRCWSCATPVAPRRVETEAVLRSRSQEDGGPYRVWSCACGMDCGALRNPAGEWLLYPLEGLAEPDLLERLVPRHSREAQRSAVAWWERHRADVERFRRARRRTAAPPPPPPPPRPPPSGARSTGPRKPPPRTRERRASPPPSPAAAADLERRSPHALLGTRPGDGPEAIRKAYRRALKLCHPDRVANLDPEIQEVAHRKSKALRRAYEALLRDAGSG